MKQFSELVNERLKLNKDTKAVRINKINNISINDLTIDKKFYCCIIENVNNNIKLVPNDDIKNNIMKINEMPEKIGKDCYYIIFVWGNEINEFECYYLTSISSSFMWFVHESKDPMYILFNTIDETKNFIENYNLYESEIIYVYKKYLELMK